MSEIFSVQEFKLMKLYTQPSPEIHPGVDLVIFFLQDHVNIGNTVHALFVKEEW